MKKRAFTLAETLIVIGIIGVVAALTLPNLNHATGDKEKVTKVKKIYSALTDAVDRAQVIYGSCDSWDIKNISNKSREINEQFAKRVTEFLKVSKECGFNSGCFSESPLLFSNGDVWFDNYLEELGHEYMVVLSDGMSLAFDNTWDSYKIRVDIDGPLKGKNQYGSDIFDFTIYVLDDYANVHGAQLNQLYPSAYPNIWTGGFGKEGRYSTAWVIENGNLDYLKCPEELNWETQTSCK